MPMSVPLPGPRVRISLTGRCGQLCAYPGAAPTTLTAKSAPAASAKVRQEPQIIGAPAIEIEDPATIAYAMLETYTCQTPAGRLGVPIPKFVRSRGSRLYELRNRRTPSN